MTTVSRTTAFYVVSSTMSGGVTRGLVTFAYKDTDPLAVHVMFRDELGEATWTFARDLLAEGFAADGIAQIAGGMDVACWRRGIWYHIGLTGTDGKGVYRVVAEQIGAFLNASHELVPYGTESAAALLDLVHYDELATSWVEMLPAELRPHGWEER